MPKPQLTRDDIRFWISEVKACEERQKKELMQRNFYPFLIKYYEGEQNQQSHQETPIAGDTIKKLAIINEYFPNTNSLIAEIMYQNPEISTEARRPEAPPPFPGMLPINVEENEPVMKSALTYGFDKLEALNENRLALFDMIYAGYSAVEVNHFFAREEVKPREGEHKVNLAQTIMNKFKAEDELEENLPPKEQSKTKDESYIHRWNPLDILLDYKANRLKELRYIIKKIRLSHSEFKAKYPQFANIVRATEAVEFAHHHENEEHRKAVLLYEIQQKQKDKYITFVIASSYDTQELDWYGRPYDTNGFNIKIGTLHKYGVLYPKSYAAVNKGMQDDINNYVTHIMEVAERNVPKRGYNKNKVKTDGIAALNSTKVMGTVPCEGGSESIWEIPGGRVTIENKELLALFDKHKEKLWSVSEARTGGKAVKPEFAEEIKVQEAGFLSRQADIQEGLRQLIREELDTLKDIIVTFWDDAHFFKITGGAKPTWYIPDVRPNAAGQPIVINPLTDILTKDYEVDVDITTALRPNKERKRAEVMEYLTWLAGTAMPILQLHGKMISIEAIEKTARDFGLNPKTLFIDMQLPAQPQEGAAA
jgi:hypothetical protein